MPDVQKFVPLAIAAAGLWAAYKFAPNSAVKTAVLGVAGIIAARQLPYVREFV